VDTSPSVRPGPLPATFTDRTGCAFAARRYGPADRTRLEAFYEAFEPKRTAQGLPPTDLDRIQRWLDQILPSGLHLLVEESCGVSRPIVGHAFLIDTHRPAEAEYAIFLDRCIRGRGIGTRVNRLAVECARAEGWHRIWLSVEPHNRAAIRSYQKVGFQFVPGSIFVADAEMILPLEPVPPAG
jgi:RimJ/RimL family protein N-acetyltransferase